MHFDFILIIQVHQMKHLTLIEYSNCKIFLVKCNFQIYTLTLLDTTDLVVLAGNGQMLVLTGITQDLFSAGLT